MTTALALAAAALFGCGTYLLLQRQLSRIIVGLALLSHGANLVILLSAQGRGEPTFVGDGDTDGLLDPLPQAFVLTAIVITFAVTCFLLALAFRSWALTRDDEVQDDVEDRLVAARSATGASEDVADADAAAVDDPPHAAPAPGAAASLADRDDMANRDDTADRDGRRAR